MGSGYVQWKLKHMTNYLILRSEISHYLVVSELCSQCAV